MGEFKGTSRDLDKILDDLKIMFKGSNYNVLAQNCNSFSDEFVLRLVNRPIPGHINRLAGIGSYFSCLFPPAITNSAPVSNSSGASSGGGGGAGGFSSITPGSRYATSSSAQQQLKPFSGKGYRLGRWVGGAIICKSTARNCFLIALLSFCNYCSMSAQGVPPESSVLLSNQSYYELVTAVPC